MAQNRVRIADVADSLGLSTATVSKVIHGKTEKISDETVKRVQQELERSGYIPNMAGILLARNNSRIIGDAVFIGDILKDVLIGCLPLLRQDAALAAAHGGSGHGGALGQGHLHFLGQSAVVGIYSYDVAISKVRKATMMAREENFPLRLECKPE